MNEYRNKIGRFGISEFDSNRYGIGYNESGEFEECTLSCGDIIEIEIDGVWLTVRIEKNEYGWYLIGESDKRLNVPYFATKARFIK